MQRLASASRRLRALVDGLTPVVIERDRAELAASPAMVALARASGKELEELVSKAAGRAVTVTIRGPEEEIAAPGGTTPETRAVPDTDIRQHPLVKATEELFGARIVRVEARPR